MMESLFTKYGIMAGGVSYAYNFAGFQSLGYDSSCSTYTATCSEAGYDEVNSSNNTSIRCTQDWSYGSFNSVTSATANTSTSWSLGATRTRVIRRTSTGTVTSTPTGQYVSCYNTSSSSACSGSTSNCNGQSYTTCSSTSNTVSTYGFTSSTGSGSTCPSSSSFSCNSTTSGQCYRTNSCTCTQTSSCTFSGIEDVYYVISSDQCQSGFNFNCTRYYTCTNDPNPENFFEQWKITQYTASPGGTCLNYSWNQSCCGVTGSSTTYTNTYCSCETSYSDSCNFNNPSISEVELSNGQSCNSSSSYCQTVECFRSIGTATYLKEQNICVRTEI